MAGSRQGPLLEILNETADFFSKNGIEESRLQAELLLADVLGLNRLDLYLQFEKNHLLINLKTLTLMKKSC